MPKKKRAKKPMRSLAMRHPELTIRMTLEQVLGSERSVSEPLAKSILDALKISDNQAAYALVVSLIRGSYPHGDAHSAALAIFKALGRG